MTAPFPFVPLNGANPAFFLLMAGIVGLAFGWFLERSGFGSAKKITAVFTSRDWDVYRVMFTAIITTMIGVQILGAVGLLELGLLEIGTTYVWAMSIGGILFGVGFYFGGFCPGTAVVAFVRGRLDGLVFIGGIILGIYGFALFFDGPGQADWFQNFFAPAGSTAIAALESPYAWFLVVVITGLVLLSFRYVYILEQRFAMRTQEELDNNIPRPPVVYRKPGRVSRRAAAATGVAVLILGVVQIGQVQSQSLASGSEIPAVVAVDEADVPRIDSLSLVGWVVADANRVAEDKAPNSHVIDVRTTKERQSAPIRNSLIAVPCDGSSDHLGAILTMVDELVGEGDANKPIVIVDGSSTAGSGLVAELRVNGINAMLLDGGSQAWESEILADDAVWPEWIVDPAAGVPTIAEYHDDVRSWMFSETDEAPAYLAIPGTMQLPSEAATVVATGGGGGGCG
ncbi:MAG: rhodanese-like domain-containing protein [Actinomycetota bacterium]